MKKLSLLLFILFFTFCNNCLGDGWTDDKNCNWFSYRHHAYSAVWLRFLGQDPNGDWDDTFYNVSYQHDKACSFEVSVSASYDGCYYAEPPSSNYQCGVAWAVAQKGPNSNFTNSWTNNPVYMLAGSKTISSLFKPKYILKFNKYNGNNKTLPFLRSGISVNQIIRDNFNNTITINNINGFISQAGHSKFGSVLQVIVWYADNPNDTILTVSKILWEAKVESNLENVKLFGGFEKNDVLLNSSVDSVSSKISIANKVIALSKNIDMKRIVVRIRTSEAGITHIDPYKPIYSMSFIQNIFPNPFSDNFNVQFGVATPRDYILKIVTSDMQTMKEISIPKGTKLISIATENIPEGVVFLQLNNGFFIDKRRLLKVKKQP